MKIRFKIGPVQMEQLEKNRKVIFRVKETEYEIRLEGVDVICFPDKDIFDALMSNRDKKDMN